MFGKGVYFADMVSKSANYCMATRDAPTAVLLLSDVALGKQHELSGALSQIGVRYLHARAQLLCGAWGESVTQLRAILDDERTLRPTLRALGVRDEWPLVRQAALAMVEAGEHHALLELVEERGLRQAPQLAEFIADALFSEYEPAAALVALDTVCAAASRRASELQGEGSPGGAAAEVPMPHDPSGCQGWDRQATVKQQIA